VVEYGLLLAGVVVLILLGGNVFGNAIFDWFRTILVRITATLR